ncbi:MAG: hypothetical protein QXS74_09690 [Nitrososphaeria archaeon]
MSEEINILKILEELKSELKNIPRIDENKIKEIVRNEIQTQIQKLYDDLASDIKDIVTPEWLENHLKTCKDPNCKWEKAIENVLRGLIKK